jgi:hypothetical protein
MNTGVLTSPWEVVNFPNRAEDAGSFFINVKLNGIIYFGLRVFILLSFRLVRNRLFLKSNLTTIPDERE